MDIQVTMTELEYEQYKEFKKNKNFFYDQLGSLVFDIKLQYNDIDFFSLPFTRNRRLEKWSVDSTIKLVNEVNSLIKG